jgi:hypothetical protein
MRYCEILLVCLYGAEIWAEFIESNCIEGRTADSKVRPFYNVEGLTREVLEGPNEIGVQRIPATRQDDSVNCACSR